MLHRIVILARPHPFASFLRTYRRTERERNFAACSRPTLARGQTADRCCPDGTHPATRLRRSRDSLRPLWQAGVFPCSADRPASLLGGRNRAGRFSAALAQRGPLSNFARASRALAVHHGPQPRARFSPPETRKAAPPRTFGFRYSSLSRRASRSRRRH